MHLPPQSAFSTRTDRDELSLAESPQRLLEEANKYRNAHAVKGRSDFRSSFPVFLGRYLVEAAGKPFVTRFKWRVAQCSSGWCVESQIDGAHHAAMAAA
jgi:hypothetical protein